MTVILKTLFVKDFCGQLKYGSMFTSKTTDHSNIDTERVSVNFFYMSGFV